MCFNQRNDIYILKGGPLKLVDKFTYLESSISSTKNDINMWLAKAINRLSVIWKSDLSDEIKCSFFQAAVLLILLEGCTTWTKRIEKKLDGNYTRMLRAVLNKSTKQQLYGHLLPIMKTIQVIWTRLMGRCQRSKHELISNVPLWTPSHGWAKIGQPAIIYIQQLGANRGCRFEDLLGMLDDWDGEWERVRKIHASSATW